MVSVNHAANNSQNQPAALPKLHWRQWDILRYIEDDCHEEEKFVTVTPGRPPRPVQRVHDYFRTHAQIKPLVDLGLLEYVRAEIYPGGACCDIYAATEAGKAAVIAYYAHSHEQTRARDDAYNAKRDAENRWAWRISCRAELERQFGVNLYLPSIFGEICESTTPFINAPMPLVAPYGSDGQPVTIREYLLILWARLLSEQGLKIMNKFLVWGANIGFEEAADMMRENSEFSAYDLFGGEYLDSDE